MKHLSLFSIAFFSFFSVLNAQNGNLQVADTIQSDALSGTNNRIVQASPNGELDQLAQGNLGEVLSQGQTGPQWAPVSSGSSSSSSTSNCTPYPCPTELSAVSANTMTYGACRRYCENLDENSFTDWRTPDLDEVLFLYGTTADENNFVWTKNYVFYEAYGVNSSNGNINTFNGAQYPIISMSTGAIEYDGGIINTNKCICVR